MFPTFELARMGAKKEIREVTVDLSMPASELVTMASEMFNLDIAKAKLICKGKLSFC